MTASAPCPDCKGRGFSYSDPDHRKIVCTSCEGEAMSETKKGKFDAAIEVLEEDIVDARYNGCESEEESCKLAIRVLDAAGKVDKDKCLDVLVNDLALSLEDQFFNQKLSYVRQIRALIESLPDEEGK